PKYRDLGDTPQELKAAHDTLDQLKEYWRPIITRRLRMKMGTDRDLQLVEAQEQVKVVQGQLKAAEAKGDRLGKEADAIGLGSIELQIKRGEIQQAEDTIKALRAERERLKVEVGSKVERITSFQQAEPPKTRSLRLQVLSAAFAGVVALALGGLGVSFWEFRRRRIYSPSEVSDDLGLHVVGTMPPS